MVHDRFSGLPNEKQERIINAALKEFAEKGFANASTNEIVKEAGISKGLLFHYFGNKQNLFLFIYDHALHVIQNEMYEKIDLTISDIFARFKQVSLLKITLISQYPDLFNFLVAAHFREDGLLKQDLDHRNQEFTDRFLVRLFDGIDTSQFRDGVDIAKATNIIHWTLDGFANQLSVRVKSLPLGSIDNDSIIAEMDELFCLLKTGLYK